MTNTAKEFFPGWPGAACEKKLPLLYGILPRKFRPETKAYRNGKIGVPACSREDPDIRSDRR